MARKAEIGEFIIRHVACPCGDSSDAYCIRQDGSGYCFGKCGGKNFNSSTTKEVNNDLEEEEVAIYSGPEQKIESRYYSHRGLTENTLRFYDIKTKFIADTPFEVGFPYPKEGSYKIRNFDEKKYRFHGDGKDPDLFGMDKFDPGSKESITITAGEYDAPSLYQVTGGKTAAVSLPSGNKAQALKVCTKHRDYINSFKKIYLALDNDKTDQETVQAISSLFDFNRVYLVKFNKFKDANDYLQNNVGPDLFRVWDGAKRYSPDNIISSFGDIKKALQDVKEDQIGTYPWSSLNKMTYGLHRGEIITIFGQSASAGSSASGIGKTEFFRALEHHLLKTTKSNIGIIHLEEDPGTTIKAISGYELGLPAVLPDSGLSTEDIYEGYVKATGNDDRRVHLYSSFEFQDEDVFLDNIRFLASGANCDFVFLDHVTWLATGMESDDERKKLDRITQKLKLLTKELRICIVMIAHTNDDGRTRGSRNIENVSNTMIKLVRDKESPDETVKNTIYFTVSKVRLGGMSGPAGYAIMDPISRRLEEPKFNDEYRIPVR